jgi:hypothetical protein
MKNSVGKPPKEPAGPLWFALALAVVLGSFGTGCASKPAPVLPVIPPCPGYSWALIDELEELCALEEVPFARCLHLYTYMEDIARYCEEVEELRK